jgi:hypothetical protein
MSNSFRPKYSEKASSLNVGNIFIKIKNVKNSQFDLVTDIEETRRSKAVRLVERDLKAISKKLPVEFEIPRIAVVDFEKHGLNSNAIAGYDSKAGIMYMNSKYDTTKKILEFVNAQKGQFANNSELAPILHELGHKYYEGCVKKLAISENIGYNKAKSIIDGRIYDYIHSNSNDELFLKKTISIYADDGFSNGKYTEVIAECFSVRDENIVADEIIKLLR